MEISKREYDEINEVESWLYNYNGINKSIENLKLEIDSMEVMKGIDYSSCSESGKTNKFNSTVENLTDRKEMIIQRIKIIENKKKQIDNALSTLNEREEIIIKKFYIEGKEYKEFVSDLGMEERNCKRIKKIALEKLIKSVYGNWGINSLG